jgi:hypothetical protein
LNPDPDRLDTLAGQIDSEKLATFFSTEHRNRYLDLSIDFRMGSLPKGNIKNRVGLLVNRASISRYDDCHGK